MCGVPVDGYGGHGVDAGKHRRDGEEVVEAAVHLPKVPLPVSRVDEVDERVEGGHGDIGESQVQQEVVGDGSHPAVRQDDPDHDQVPEDGHRQHGAIRQRPERDAPRRLHELVGEIPGDVGFLPSRGHSSSVLGEDVHQRADGWPASINHFGTSDARQHVTGVVVLMLSAPTQPMQQGVESHTVILIQINLAKTVELI